MPLATDDRGKRTMQETKNKKNKSYNNISYNLVVLKLFKKTLSNYLYIDIFRNNHINAL